MIKTLEQSRMEMEGCGDSEWANYLEGLIRQHEHALANPTTDKTSSNYIPLCATHAQSWFCERDHLVDGLESECVVCAHSK